MRIIGGHDYYDSGLAYGRDDDILFIRDGRVIKGKDASLKWHNGSTIESRRSWGWGNDSGRHYAKVDGKMQERLHRGITVYVANKAFYGIEVKDYIDGNFHTTFWNFSKFEEYVIEHKLKLVTPQHWDGRWIKDMSVEDRFKPRDISRAELDWMIDNRIAIAVGHGDDEDKREWHCNDAKEFALKNFHFQRTLDPYTLFQELSMFVGNWPQAGNPMVVITDNKVKAAKHGFDNWSFRRHKEDSKKNMSK